MSEKTSTPSVNNGSPLASQQSSAFQLRIVTVDSYLAEPIDDFDDVKSNFSGNKHNLIPVIRIFGVTPNGQKGCIHVHGYYPYLSINVDKYNYSEIAKLKKQIGNELNRLLSIRKNTLNRNYRYTHHVYKIELVELIPFYGYYAQRQKFFRIFLYNPYLIQRATELLESGNILSTVFQPYEAHIPYILKFFIEFDLQGMNFINLKTIKLRENDNSGGGSIRKLTICEIEGDCTVDQIITQSVNAGEIFTGLKQLWDDERARRRKLSLPSQITPKCSQEKDFTFITDSELDCLKQLQLSLLQNLNLGNVDIIENVDIVHNKLSQSIENTIDEITDRKNKTSNFSSQDFANIMQSLVDTNNNENDDEKDIVDEEAEISQEMSQVFIGQSSQHLNNSDDNFCGDNDDDDDGKFNEEIDVNENFPVNLSIDNNIDVFNNDGDDDLLASVEFTNDPDNTSNLNTQTNDKCCGVNMAELAQEECNSQDVEFICDCTGNECCDYCCDGLSEKCYCDDFIPQVDGAFDTVQTRKHSKRLKNDCTTSAMQTTEQNQRSFSNSKYDLRNKFRINYFKNTNIRLPDYLSKMQLCQIGNECVLMERLNENKKDDSMSIIKYQDSRLEEEVKSKSIKRGRGQRKQVEAVVVQKSKESIVIENTNNEEKKDDYDDNKSNETITLSPSCLENLDIDESEINNNNHVDENLKQLSQNSEISDKSFMNVFSSSSENDASIFSFYDKTIDSQCSMFSQSSFSLEESVDFIHSTPFSDTKKKKFRRSKKKKNFTQLRDITIYEELPLDENNDLKTMTVIKKFDSEKNVKSISKLDNKTVIRDSQSPSTSFLKRRDTNKVKRVRHVSNSSLIEGPSRSGTFDFNVSSLTSESRRFVESSHENQYLTIMSVEVFATTQGDKKPNPLDNCIRAIFFAIKNEKLDSTKLGMIVVSTDPNDSGLIQISDISINPGNSKFLLRSGYTSSDVDVVTAINEIDLMMKFVEVIQLNDPDILIGYEIELSSLNYILQRASALNIELLTALSRLMYVENINSVMKNEQNLEETDYGRHLRIPGRVLLNLWKILRHEIKLTSYTYESVHYHVLHERVPYFDESTLNQWFDNNLNRWRAVEYFLIRVEGEIKLLEKLNLIEQYSELARVFGIQFYEVISRGSQFRVESMMLRYAKRYDYVMVSPSTKQRVEMRPPEHIALVMEPESKFYTDPVIVLDFQSLYPSIIIAYNYCYSTCLGRLDSFLNESSFKFGCITIDLVKKELAKFSNLFHISPNGVVFLKPQARKGILPEMLSSILDTRLMVKDSIKENDKREKPNKALNKLLNARQLGLKLIANVTYGYTAANFTGRMPCVEIADAIVSKGRETLERAIKFVNESKEWNCRVVYGDTDSLFIHLPGCTKEEAFKKGEEIASAITALNPKPIKLKFEKVYLPCILETKKHYVGFSYEKPNQNEPKFDAKGIETVRRDTCPAASKMLEKSLKIFFTSYDINDVKPYVVRQFEKILKNRISNLKDFIFAREYRGEENYQTIHVPALVISKKLKSNDKRAEPRKGERVPHVIVYGAPNESLINLVRQPIELIKNPSIRINAEYYIERIIIPTLNRAFQLVGTDVFNWYKEMPKKIIFNRSSYFYSKQNSLKPKTLTQYFLPSKCIICEANINSRFNHDFLESYLCQNCLTEKQTSAVHLIEDMRHLETKYNSIIKICQSCNGSNNIEQNCLSIDCPNLFYLSQIKFDYSSYDHINALLSSLEF